MTPAALIRETSRRFRESGIPDPETDSALLLSFLCGGAPLALRLDTESELSQDTVAAYSVLSERRLSREPLQYITGEAPFCGRVFYVDSRVLIPRPETELLCSWALELLPDRDGIRVLDLCCGSGCIGLTIAAERPSYSITLSDLSGDALSVASKNAESIGAKVSLHRGDLTADLPRAFFDCVISNPPYIPSAECACLQPEVCREPVLALDGGTDGLFFYRRIASEVSAVLKKHGILLLELGFGESEAVSSILSAAGFTNIEIRSDWNGIPRMIMAVSSRMEDTCSTD